MKNNEHNFPFTLSIVHADDDQDDCLLFKEILEELPLTTMLTTLHNGEQLMQMLHEKSTELPDVVFLDLNMPRKNGYHCLSEIKSNKKLNDIPVIIYSTSYEEDIVDLLYKNGAHFYIRKPGAYSELKKIINLALTLLYQNNNLQPARENFLLTEKKK